MILSVVQEILSYRYKAPKQLFTKWFTATKIALLISSIAVPMAAPAPISLAFASSLIIFMAVIGLRRCAIYTAFSSTTLYLIMVFTAFLLHGDIGNITRLTLLASSSLSTILLTASTTKPSMLRKWPILYLFSVVFTSTLREIMDVSIVYRARGSGGIRYVLQVIIASMALAITRANTLADSLKARGVEVVE